MSKEFWHTWTLFIQAWKFKWSYNYEHCIKCWTVTFKHKWRWLCTSCWEKERDKTKRRQEVKRKAWSKWHKEHYIYSDWSKKKWPKPFLTKDDKKTYKKEYMRKHRERYKIIKEWKERKEKWLSYLEYNINWKIIYLPFWDLVKPNCTTNNMYLYDEWKEKIRKFNIIKNFYEKTIH